MRKESGVRLNCYLAVQVVLQGKRPCGGDVGEKGMSRDGRWLERCMGNVKWRLGFQVVALGVPDGSRVWGKEVGGGEESSALVGICSHHLKGEDKGRKGSFPRSAGVRSSVSLSGEIQLLHYLVRNYVLTAVAINDQDAYLPTHCATGTGVVDIMVKPLIIRCYGGL